jgi:predicted metal-dependent hydrolase
MRDLVKNDPVIIEKFKEYGVSLDDIDDVHVEFCDLDVSAKTKDKKIYLNKSMLADDSPVKDPTHYLVHELIHYLQQSTGKNMNKHRKDEEYLDKETEEEAFKAQVDFKKREESEEEAEEYVENLLDHHDMKGNDRKEKREELLDE